MSLSNNFPAIKPSLNLDFANTKRLDPRITFTRTTTATYYDGVTTSKAEENLLLQSQDFSTTWVGDGTTITTNTQTAPDGTSTADVLVNTAATEAHYVRQAFAFVAGQTYTLSCFIKKGTVQYVALVAYVNSSNNAGAGFDLDAPSATAGGTGTGYSATNATITSVGNSWYRCSVEVTIGTTVATTFRIWNRDSAYTSGNFFNSYLGTTSEETYLWGAQLEQRSAVSSYTPTTTQPITNYIPVLLTAASGVARFDHNPTTGESLGLLVEEQRTNLFTRSEEFNTANWGKANSSVTDNVTISPNGTLTAEKLIADTTNSDSHSVSQGTITSGTTYTVSIYAKAGEYQYIFIRGMGLGGSGGARFNLANGTVEGISGYSSATIQSVGNGWYRCIAVGTATSTTGPFFSVSNTASFLSYTGDGYSGIYIWGAQLEAGAFPTSYIPTTSATVTRNADAASMTGTNFSSWYRADEGTLYVESQTNQASAASVPRRIFISDGTSSNNINLNNGASGFQGGVSVNGTSQAFFAVGGYTSNSTKQSVAYKVNDFNYATNGTASTADTSGTLPVVNQVNIGSAPGTNFLNGTIKKISFYPSRLSDAQIVALTT